MPNAVTPPAMARPPGLAEHCVELLSTLGSVRAKRMFGGHGFYVDDVFVALVAGETLYLKVDDQTRARFVDAGCRMFTYHGKERTASMSYWTVPDDAMESPAAMTPWARLAMEAAWRARAAARPRAAAKKVARKKAVAKNAAKTPRR